MSILSDLQAIKPAKDEQGYSAIVPLAAEARLPLETAAARWTAAQRFSSELFSSALGRGRQYTLRLAGILQVATHLMTGKTGLPEAVGAEAIESAIAIVDSYILPMSERVFAAGDTKPSDAAALARYLARTGKPVINARADIMRGRGSPLMVREAIEELEQQSIAASAETDPKCGHSGPQLEIPKAAFRSPRATAATRPHSGRSAPLDQFPKADMAFGLTGEQVGVASTRCRSAS